MDILLELGVESVLDCIVCAAWKGLCDLAPLVPEIIVHLQNDSVLLRRPFLLANVWVQMIVPSLTTLLPDSPGQSIGDGAPVFSTKLLNHCAKDFIFFASPWPLRNKGLVSELEPSVEALDLRSADHTFANLVPALVSEFFNKC